MRFRLLVFALLAALSAFNPVLAQGPGDVCRANQTDHAERPAPAQLLQRLGKTFGVAPDVVRGQSYVRCDQGRLMGCIIGANLNCGRANVARHLAGADAFCRDNPSSDSVPLAATGHDTIYDWHCAGTHAVAGRIMDPVDRLGFMAGNWKPLR